MHLVPAFGGALSVLGGGVEVLDAGCDVVLGLGLVATGVEVSCVDVGFSVPHALSSTVKPTATMAMACRTTATTSWFR